MGNETIIKLALLNIGIAMLNIILFSEGFIGIKIGGFSVFETSLAVTVIVMSAVIFIFANYKLLFEKNEIIHTKDLKTSADYIDALKHNLTKKTFAKDILNIIEQTEKFDKKKKTIKNILLQKFNKNEMSYSKFEGVLLNVESVFYLNIKSIINKLNAFDEDDYKLIHSDIAEKKYSKEFIQSKMDIYNEYITFIRDSIKVKEQILLKLDELLLEITKFNSFEEGEIENMTAMKDLDKLIEKTKFYK
ncbi:hypothetical protein [Natronospora cellulosivora (SeqCode)]